jgi:hypothetical protein
MPPIHPCHSERSEESPRRHVNTGGSFAAFRMTAGSEHSLGQKRENVKNLDLPFSYTACILKIIED